MSQIDDVETVHDYLLNTPSKTPAAETIRTATLSWYDSAGFWDKNLNGNWFDQLRTKRNQFNIANAVTPSEKETVTRILTTGITKEEIEGKPRPKIDAKTGAVGSVVPHPLSAAGQPVLARVLKQGLNGDDVKTWQSFLGLTPPTGYFDALTATKTKAFQQSKKLTTDGAVGKVTWGSAFPIVQTSDFAPSAVDTSTLFQSPPPVQTSAPAPSHVAFSLPHVVTATHVTSSVPGVATAKAGVAAVKTAVSNVVEAGMIPTSFDPTKWSTGAKIVGGIAAVALAGFAVVRKQAEIAAYQRSQ